MNSTITPVVTPKMTKKEFKAKMKKLYDEGMAIVKTGTCPCCGAKLALNGAIKNWWVCVHRGSPGFQKVAGKPCDWQVILPDID